MSKAPAFSAFQLPAFLVPLEGCRCSSKRTPQDYPQPYRTLEEGEAERQKQRPLFMVVDSDLDYNNPLAVVKVYRSRWPTAWGSVDDIGGSLAVLVGRTTNRFGMTARS